MKSKLFAIAVISPIFVLAGCGTSNNSASSSTAPTNTSNRSTSQQTSASTIKTHFKIQVIVDKKNGKPKMVPAFVPANLTLPENKDVTITVQNFDDGGAAIPSGGNKVQGTVSGTMTVDGKAVSSVPVKKVAHTITIAQTSSFKGLNIPIEARTSSERSNSIVFTFHTPSKPTQLKWQCDAACGSGSSGMGGVMDLSKNPGYMNGTWTVK
ncbi:hypothetical protein [Alicyclobacillus sp. SO9]|uniref:hypothetical protein n=1 Tax=Alicyclobacillus sp. SO9 TaxID=2665646 RepID=UPI0018E7F23A|nr:hypothetical protein [Alicyclobacillus sp. SO9]QQE79881.1 hypothetical protein GI364_05190 [Alicyclobacillus sp. SO9]